MSCNVNCCGSGCSIGCNPIFYGARCVLAVSALILSITALVIGILGLLGIIPIGLIGSACLVAFSIPCFLLSCVALLRFHCRIN